jgi:diguanylate cyclase (GGDEF)-like protein
LVAPKLASSITNGLRFRLRKSQAGVDGLTGLPNPAALAARLTEMEGTSAVVVCDLNGFKRLNDTLGHLTGNRLLQALAEGFRGSCRDGDFVARLGGDEFVLLLAGAQPEGMPARIGQFEEMVRNVSLDITGTDLLSGSFGAAYYPAEGKSAEELLAKADQRMYRDKAERMATAPSSRGQLVSKQ